MHLQALTLSQHSQGNLEAAEGPVLLQKRLQAAHRVLRFIGSGKISVSTKALMTECTIKHDRSKRANRTLGFLLFFVTFACAVVGQRNGSRGEEVHNYCPFGILFSRSNNSYPHNIV